jgi:hypothetical protein
MLTCVLLHVIKSTGPIENSLYLVLVRWQGVFQDVNDGAILLSHDDVKQSDPAQCSPVSWLATGCGVESCTVEDNGGLAVPYRLLDRLGEETGAVWICVVQSFSHPASKGRVK